MAKKIVSPTTIEALVDIIKEELASKLSDTKLDEINAAIKEVDDRISALNHDNMLTTDDIITDLDNYTAETDAGKILAASIVIALKTQMDSIFTTDENSNVVPGVVVNSKKLDGLAKDDFVQRTDVINDWADYDESATASQLATASLIKAGIDNIETTVDNKISAVKGSANGVASLDENGKVPASELPSYVDDVIEAYLVVTPSTEEGVPDTKVMYEDAEHTKEITPERGKIYMDLPTNDTYRWSGSTYVKVGSSDFVEMTAEEVREIWDRVNNSTSEG